MNDTVETLVKAILANAKNFEWSLQGMGMLRLHLPDNRRLHIWDSRFRRPGVSMIHDHIQWGLSSRIIAGRLTNKRYVIDDPDIGMPYTFSVLKPGYGCFFKTEPELTYLRPLHLEVYEAGETYAQGPSEIHETDAEDGTVTLMTKFPTEDESARVFWPAGTEWGSAEPRVATAGEVDEITRNAIARWFA
jgi:hypothetical protein